MTELLTNSFAFSLMYKNVGIILYKPLIFGNHLKTP